MFDNLDYAVRDIFTNATTYLEANKNNIGRSCGNSNSPPPYYYSIAEIGYLQEFAVDQPTTFQMLQDVGTLLRIVGGGITSPDNPSLSRRNVPAQFLIANTWQAARLHASTAGASQCFALRAHCRRAA